MATKQKRYGRDIDEEMAAAYHEAGHVGVAYDLKVPFSAVTIVPVPDEHSLGHVTAKIPDWLKPDTDNSARSRSYIERRIITILAGHAAEKLYRRRNNWEGSQDDLYQATRWADQVCGSPKEADAYLKWLAVRAELWVQSHLLRGAIGTLAHTLKERKTIRSATARTIIRRAIEASLYERTSPSRGT